MKVKLRHYRVAEHNGLRVAAIKQKRIDSQAARGSQMIRLIRTSFPVNHFHPLCSTAILLMPTL